MSDSQGKPRFSPRIMRILRQRKGLEPQDTSYDSEINELMPHQALSEVCGWELGDPQWATVFLKWAMECGYTITKKE